MSYYSNVTYGGYGAYELKSRYQRGMLFGTLTAALMVLMIIVAAHIRSELGPETVRIDVDRPAVIESVIRLPLQKSFKTERPKKAEAGVRARPVVGTMPVMVGDDEFIRGDANGDAQVGLADAIAVLTYQFQFGPMPCMDAGDANDSESVDLADAIYILTYQFSQGQYPDPPFGYPIDLDQHCGPDPTDDPHLYTNCFYYPKCR